MLKQLEQTKSLERLKKLHGKLPSLTSFISTNYVQQMHKDLKFWKSINSKVYLAKKKSILTSFLEGITSQSLCNAFLLFVIVEAIYQRKNLIKFIKLIQSHCFLTNLFETLSGSKTVKQ